MRKLRDSFIYAFKGIICAAGERNMRIHLCFAFYVIIAGFVLDIGTVEWACVLICTALVLTAECFNTAVEAFCDAVHPEHNDAIGRVKDISAASVLISAVVSAAAGMVIFFGRGRPHAAWVYFKTYPVIAAGVLLSFIVWLFIIFKAGNKEKNKSGD